MEETTFFQVSLSRNSILPLDHIGNGECSYSVQRVTVFACLISALPTYTAETFCESKDTTHRVKGNPGNGRKYLQITYLIRDSYLEYIKNS